MIKKIGILTSGGDSPGMNCAIRAVVRSALARGIEVYGIHYGYKGLIDDDIEKLDRWSVSNILFRGGTILKTARCPEFKEKEYQLKGIENLKKHGIEALVVIGGDGTYMGAKKLTELGINCVGLPGTIDNDIASTDYTIGFDTCCNTIIACIDRIRDTTDSHDRCSIIQVMGNQCGDLTLWSALSEGAEVVITPEHPMSNEELVEVLNKMSKEGKKRAIVIVTEKLYASVHELGLYVTAHTPYEAKTEVLGRIQRGGSPNSFDRVMATRMGAYAVDKLIEGKGGICVGLVKNEIVSYDIYEALKLPRNKHDEILRLINLLA